MVSKMIPEWIEKRLAELPQEELNIFSCRGWAGVIDWGYILCDFEIKPEVKIGGRDYRLQSIGRECGKWAYQIGRC